MKPASERYYVIFRTGTREFKAANGWTRNAAHARQFTNSVEACSVIWRLPNSQVTSPVYAVPKSHLRSMVREGDVKISQRNLKKLLAGKGK